MIIEFVSTTFVWMCVYKSICCDLLLKLLYPVSEDFSKAVSDFIMVVTGTDDSFCLKFPVWRTDTFTFSQNKILRLLVDIKNECSHNVVLDRCE